MNENLLQFLRRLNSHSSRVQSVKEKFRSISFYQMVLRKHDLGYSSSPFRRTVKPCYEGVSLDQTSSRSRFGTVCELLLVEFEQSHLTYSAWLFLLPTPTLLNQKV
ncbi:hypothetical protein AVEN_220539-1 [Araneus ventricosus]|uniref:Uncharacterized protein n=1 Tax=Araneus ventricosus TaxID=182803 RepID=A0A4Y1ZU20_ARAVE|nr:hypothetical protein AVEN_224747-1 [Araneus ventricosus]GBL67507.1 hypothetical protein AVEN_51221-1 [Araneus ventricosus]GBL67539.1 hypothetical protein AVEN_144250-1 [Araneus ventricosus]GBL67587.1 hypothetical protein AVEN_220539-1 [Araneus ventricosus]